MTNPDVTNVVTTAVRIVLGSMTAYSISLRAEGARLLGVSPATLKQEASYNRCEEYRREGRWRFTWRQLALIAFRMLTLEEVVAALGNNAATALPPLLALRSVILRLPEYIVREFETVAAEDRTTVDSYLSGAILDFARDRSSAPRARSCRCSCDRVRQRRRLAH
jgi:hypothetical protein